MFNAILIFVSLLLSVSYDLCQSNISPPTVVPKTAVATIRANVSFQCMVNLTDFPFWQFLNITNTQDVTILLKNGVVDRMKSRYRTSNSSVGPYVLIIDHIDHGHAGRYICIGRDSVTIASAELTVIDSDPVCGASTMENNTIRIWCEINSTGNLIPLMKWTKDNDAIENNTTQNITINGSTTTTSFVRLQIQPQDNDTIEGITVKCTTSFIWKNGSRENIPHYEHVWIHTLSLLFANDASSTPPEEWNTVAICVSSSIVILIFIILCIAFQRIKKKAKGSTSSTTSPLNTGSSGEAESTEREREGKRLPKTQRRDFEEHGTESVEAYETFTNRPTAAMHSEVYCELNLTEQEKPKTKSAILNAKKRGAQTQPIETYEMLANQPSAAMQSETYCKLNLSKKDKPKSKSLPSAALEDEKQEYQTIDEYETFTNLPSPVGQSETYCELQIMKKKERQEKENLQQPKFR